MLISILLAAGLALGWGLGGSGEESNCQEAFWVFHLIPAPAAFPTASRGSDVVQVTIRLWLFGS